VVVRFANQPPAVVGTWLKSDRIAGKTRFAYCINHTCWIGYGDSSLIEAEVRAAGGAIALQAPEGTKSFIRRVRSRIPI
jgi:hypothetical protein